MKRKERNMQKAGLFAVIWAMALLFGISIFRGSGLEIDYAILNFVRTIVHPVLTAIMIFFTKTGDPIFYVILLVLVAPILIKRKQYRELILLLASVLISFFLNEAMKAIFQRVRPVGYAQIIQEGYSYPSGHSMVAASFYLTVAWLIREKRVSLQMVSKGTAGYAFLPGLSRIYLGVHYPTDVLAGWILGISVAGLCIRMYRNRR